MKYFLLMLLSIGFALGMYEREAYVVAMFNSFTAGMFLDALLTERKY